MLGVGKYNVTITDFGLVENSNKTSVFVEFENIEGPRDRIKWYGGLGSDAQKKYSLDQLSKLGFDGDWNRFSSNDLSVLQCDKTWEIVVIEDKWDGGTSIKVKWINDPEKAPLAQKLNQAAVVEKVSSLNLKGDWEQRKALKKSTGTDEDIPF